MCRTLCREYFKQDWLEVRPFWKNGWIHESLKVLFWVLAKLSLSRIIVFCMGRRLGATDKRRYLAVDWYVFAWFIFELFIFFLLLKIFPAIASNHVFNIILLVLISYRLFDIFQSWISQFVLGGVPAKWKPINIYRSLVLVFIGYFEVIISYALLIFTLKNNFQGISSLGQALYCSVRCTATIGYDITPIGCTGYAVLITQIMFVILFITAAVNTIISHTLKR
jgi:hypothetical protein